MISEEKTYRTQAKLTEGRNSLKTSLLFSLFFSLLLISCDSGQEEVSTDLINIVPSAENSIDKETLPILSFEELEHDFGKILEGEKVSYTFSFENTGKSPLVISQVEPSCGCTMAKDWSTAPYSPGDKGSITVEFDSNKRPGKQNKTISIIANTFPAVTKLTLVGEVAGPGANK